MRDEKMTFPLLFVTESTNSFISTLISCLLSKICKRQKKNSRIICDPTTPIVGVLVCFLLVLFFICTLGWDVCGCFFTKIGSPCTSYFSHPFSGTLKSPL